MKVFEITNSEKEDLLKRLYKHRIIDSNNHWLWQGAKTKTNHGRIKFRRKMYYTHVLIMMLLNKEYDENKFCLHKIECSISKCFNPEHLYQGTKADNINDQVKIGTHRNSSKTHCKKGHEFTIENTYICRNGSRACKICNKKNLKSWRLLNA